MEKKAGLINTIRGIVPAPEVTDESLLIRFVETAHEIVADDALKNKLEKLEGSFPKDFGYSAVQEYYEEPWIIELRTAVARYLFCTYAKANKTVKGKRAGNPHKVCIHVTIGRATYAAVADLVSSTIVEAVRRKAHEDARQALEDARNRSIQEPDTRTWSHSAKRELGSRIVEAIERRADEAAFTRTELQPIYAIEARLADMYIANELGGRQTLSTKKLKIAA